MALILRLGMAFLLPLPADFMYLTEPGWTAANLAAGRGYTYDFYGTRLETPLLAFVPPLHPFLIYLALRCPDPALTLGVFQAVLGTLTVFFIHRLARGLTGRRAGMLAGWGAALYPAHVLMTSQPPSAILHACCLTAVLLAVWRLYKRPAVGQALLAGGLTGLFALSRPQILGFIPATVGWLWLNGLRGRRLWRLIAALTLTVVVVVLPWCVRNTLLFGRPTFISTNGGVTFWNGNNPFTTGSGHDVYADRLAAYREVERDPSLPDVYDHPAPYPFPPEIEARLQTIPELELSRESYRAGLDYIRQHPIDWLRLEGHKLVSFWWFRPNLGANALYRGHWTSLYRIQYAILFVFTIVGGAISARQWRRYALIYAILAYYTLIHLAFHVLTRYRWEIELLMLIFAALTLETIWRRVSNSIKSYLKSPIESCHPWP